MNNIWLIITIFFILNPIAKHIAYNNGRTINNFKLPDIFHNKIFNLKSISFINNYFLGMLILYTLYQLSLKKIQSDDIDLFIKLLCKLMVIKLILMNVTTLPDASGKCMNEDKLKNKFNFYFISGCNDLIFSFHMTITLLLLFILKKNNIISNNTYIIVAVIHAIIIITTQNHYTIDVLLAFIIVDWIINK